MSLLRDAIKQGHKYLSGIAAIDVRGIFDTEVDPTTLVGCQSPFTSPSAMVPDGVKLREGARVCGWYELNLDPALPIGVLLAEDAIQRIQVYMIYMKLPSGRVAALSCGSLEFNEEWGMPKMAVDWTDFGHLVDGERLVLSVCCAHALVRTCFANSLANCVNVAFVEDDSGQHTRRNRAQKLHRGIVWRRLVIGHPSKHRRDGKLASGHEPMNRMHLARGHFKTFTADKPLLGKHVGRWWWSPQVRGSKEVGVVVKEYAIEEGRP